MAFTTQTTLILDMVCFFTSRRYLIWLLIMMNVFITYCYLLRDSHTHSSNLIIIIILMRLFTFLSSLRTQSFLFTLNLIFFGVQWITFKSLYRWALGWTNNNGWVLLNGRNYDFFLEVFIYKPSQGIIIVLFLIHYINVK